MKIEWSPEQIQFACTYRAFPRSAKLCLALALLVIAGMIHYAVMRHEIAPQAVLGVLGFLVWPVIARQMTGQLEVTASRIVGRASLGGFVIDRSTISYIELYGRRRRDNLGVRIVGARRIVVKQIWPESAIQVLLGLHPRPSAELPKARVM